MSIARIRFGFIACVSILLTSACAVSEAYRNSEIEVVKNSDEQVTLEREKFLDSSGYQLPSNVKLIDGYDSRGGFLGDGIYYLAFEATDESIQSYLQSNLWESAWRNEPMLPVMFLVTKDLEDYREELSSPDTQFIFDNDRGDTYPSSGRMMVIMPLRKTVLYFQWVS